MKQNTFDPGDVVFFTLPSGEDAWPEYPAGTAGVVRPWFGDELCVQTAWGSVEDIEEGDVRPALEPVEWVRRAVKDLQAMMDTRGDDERAHRWRDEIAFRVLQWTADGRHDAAALAAAALEADKIRFSRWYA